MFYFFETNTNREDYNNTLEPQVQLQFVIQDQND